MKRLSRVLVIALVVVVALVGYNITFPAGKSATSNWTFVLAHPTLLLHVIVATRILVMAVIALIRSVRKPRPAMDGPVGCRAGFRSGGVRLRRRLCHVIARERAQLHEHRLGRCCHCLRNRLVSGPQEGAPGRSSPAAGKVTESWPTRCRAAWKHRQALMSADCPTSVSRSMPNRLGMQSRCCAARSLSPSASGSHAPHRGTRVCPESHWRAMV